MTPAFSIVFKNSSDIPEYAYMPNSFTLDPFLSYPFSNTSLNTIYVSFKVDDCRKTYWMSRTNRDIEGIRNALYQSGSNIEIPYPEEGDAYLRAKIFKQFYDINPEAIPSMANSFVKVSENDNRSIRKILQEIECFTGVKFIFNAKVASFNYQLSFCGYQDSTEEHAGYSRVTYEPVSTSGVIVLDPDDISHNVKVVGTDNYRVNTWLHETLHTLGLWYTEYNNLSQQKKYRSAAANDDDENSFLSKICYKDLESKLQNPQEFMRAYIKCLKLPIHLQPLDIVRLQKLVGLSHNDSDSCIAMQEAFCTKHKNVLEICGRHDVVHDDL